MKAYKKYSTACKNAGNDLVVRVGDFYIVGMKSYNEIAVINESGCVVGHITVKHLSRLGNANYAISQD